MSANQNDLVLKHLRTGPITQLQAYDDLGITRLGARVFDLRAMGFTINSTLVARKNRRGEKCRVAEYSLLEKKL